MCSIFLLYLDVTFTLILQDPAESLEDTDESVDVDDSADTAESTDVPAASEAIRDMVDGDPEARDHDSDDDD